MLASIEEEMTKSNSAKRGLSIFMKFWDFLMWAFDFRFQEFVS